MVCIRSVEGNSAVYLWLYSAMKGPDVKFNNIYTYIYTYIGFCGLGVACWPSVPKFAGSNSAEAVGFLGRKNPQHAFSRRGSKAVGPMP